MHPFGRIVFAGLAVFVCWTIIRAMRSGVIFSRDQEFTADERPIAFSVVFAVHLLILAFLIWCAAGYDPSEFSRVMGIPMAFDPAPEAGVMV